MLRFIMNALPPESEDRLKAAFAEQRRAFHEQGPLSPDRRAQALEALAQALIRHANAVTDAVSQDFGHRSAAGTKLGDLYRVVVAARHARRHFRRWMKPSRRSIGLPFRPASGQVVFQPLGVVGIISPWNYPV